MHAYMRRCVLETLHLHRRGLNKKRLKSGVRKLKIRKKLGTVLWLVLTIAFPIRFTMKNRLKEELS